MPRSEQMPTKTSVLFELWGKYRVADRDRSADFHPAVFHMLDVGLVARALMSVWADRFARLLGCASEAELWVPFLVAAHDVGELAGPAFQQKVLGSSPHRDAPGLAAPLSLPSCRA